MADLTTLSAAVLGDGDIHATAEFVVALNHLLDENGWTVVALAVVAAAYRLGMSFLNRWRPMKRRDSDAPSVVVNTSPPPSPSAGLPPVPLVEKPPTSAAPPQ